MLAALPLQVKQMLRAVAPLASMKDDTPMARLEWVDTDAPLESATTSDGRCERNRTHDVRRCISKRDQLRRSGMTKFRRIDAI